ncbi:hypothetical protein GALL_477350 [mine drainage metagenome]|uniref:Uncharacterized protein n=1 Tax=mine drainage metagenome TaxID=410659 RepID=A0A1J5PHE9_9ZZZZ
MQQRAAWRHRDHGQRIRHILGSQRGAFERVERDIHRRALAGADLLTDEQHRRLVALSLADHHDAVDIQQVQLLAHRVDSGLIGGLLIAAPDHARRGQRRRLRHTRETQRQHAIVKLDGIGHDNILAKQAFPAPPSPQPPARQAARALTLRASAQFLRSHGRQNAERLRRASILAKKKREEGQNNAPIALVQISPPEAAQRRLKARRQSVKFRLTLT